MFDLLFKSFPLSAVLLQVATWVCFRSWLYSPFISALSPVHLFDIFFKLLWKRGSFKVEVSTTFKNKSLLHFPQNILRYHHMDQFPEATTKGVLWKNMFLKMSKSSWEIFKNFKSTYFEEHLWATPPECRWKKSPVLVLGKSMLENDTIQQKMFFVANMNLMKFV